MAALVQASSATSQCRHNPYLFLMELGYHGPSLLDEGFVALLGAAQLLLRQKNVLRMTLQMTWIATIIQRAQATRQEAQRLREQSQRIVLKVRASCATKPVFQKPPDVPDHQP